MAVPSFIKKYWPALVNLGVFSLLGIALGVGVTATGIFAPFGVTLLGLVAAGSILFGGSLVIGLVVSAAIAAFRNANPPLENYQLVENEEGEEEGEEEENPKSIKNTENNTDPSPKPTKTNSTSTTDTNSASASESPPPQSLVSSSPAPTATPVESVVYPPVLGSAPQPSLPLVATQEDAERVKAYIVKLAEPEKEGVSSKGELCTSSLIGEHLTDLLVIKKLENSNDYEVTLKKKTFFLSKNFFPNDKDDDLDEKGMGYYPKALNAFVTAINTKWGEKTAIPTSEQRFGQRAYFYEYNFTISPENVAKILATIPADNTFQFTKQ